MEHTLALNDVRRTWRVKQGWYHLVCSCGKHIVGRTVEETTAFYEQHVRESG